MVSQSIPRRELDPYERGNLREADSQSTPLSASLSLVRRLSPNFRLWELVKLGSGISVLQTCPDQRQDSLCQCRARNKVQSCTWVTFVGTAVLKVPVGSKAPSCEALVTRSCSFCVISCPNCRIDFLKPKRVHRNFAAHKCLAVLSMISKSRTRLTSCADPARCAP